MNALYQAHVLIHKGLKPFKCKECGKEFRRGDKLSVHLKQLHGPNTKLGVVEKKSIEKRLIEKKIIEKRIIKNVVKAKKIVNPIPVQHEKNFNKFVESESIYSEQIKNTEHEKNGDDFKKNREIFEEGVGDRNICVKQGEIVDVVKSLGQEITIETVPTEAHPTETHPLDANADANPSDSSIPKLSNLPESSNTVPFAPPPPELNASRQLPDLPLLTPRPTSYRDPAPVLPIAPVLFIGPPPKPLETENIEEVRSSVSESSAGIEKPAEKKADSEKLSEKIVGIGEPVEPVTSTENTLEHTLENTRENSTEKSAENSAENSTEKSIEKPVDQEAPKDVKSIVVTTEKVPETGDSSETDKSAKTVTESSENKQTASDDAPVAKKRKRNLSSPNEQSLSREQLAHLVGKNHENDDLSFGDVMNWESINPKMDMLH